MDAPQLVCVPPPVSSAQDGGLSSRGLNVLPSASHPPLLRLDVERLTESGSGTPLVSGTLPAF